MWLCNSHTVNHGFTIGNWKIPGNDPYADGWRVVYELEDDNNVDDVPNDHMEIFKGYKRANSYFVGVEDMGDIEFTQVSF